MTTTDTDTDMVVTDTDIDTDTDMVVLDMLDAAELAAPPAGCRAAAGHFDGLR